MKDPKAHEPTKPRVESCRADTPPIDAMRARIIRVALLGALCLASTLSACATAAVSAAESSVERSFGEQPAKTEAWPEDVKTQCPDRKQHLECFRRSEIQEGMAALAERWHALHPHRPEPLLVKVRVETLGGKPTCVEWTPREDETARAVATVVAHHFSIQGSQPEERCSLTYPVKFTSE